MNVRRYSMVVITLLMSVVSVDAGNWGAGINWEIGVNWQGLTISYPTYEYSSFNCATIFDYCYLKTGVKIGNYTIKASQIVGSDDYLINGISQSNIDGFDYYTGNMSRVFISLSTGNDGISDFNTTDDTIIVVNDSLPSYPVYDPRYEPSNLTVCFGDGLFNYTYKPFVGSDLPLPQRDFIDGSTLTSYYRRNWTFNREYVDTLVAFSGYSSTLTILCDNYGSFNYNLTNELPSGGSLTIQTLERPRFRLYLKTVFNASDPSAFYATEHIREDEDHYLQGNYYVNNESLMYSFSLLDYTSQCNNLIKFSRLVDNNEQIIWLSEFDNDRNVYPFLQNNTEYRLKIYCIDGSVRDLGYVKTISQNQRNIEVTNINIIGEQTVYSGGLRIGNLTADYDSEMVYLPYSKDEGYIQNITFCLYNLSAAPMSEIYCSGEQYVTAGSFSYDTNNRDANYLATLYVENDGKVIQNNYPVQFVNNSHDPYQDKGCKICPLPPELMGVSDTVLYKAIGLLGMLVLGLAFARIDAGYAPVAVIGWELLMDRIGWHDVPAWLMISAVLLALALLWGLLRRHDE